MSVAKNSNAQKRAALKTFSKIMSHEVQEKGYSEDDVVRSANEARKRVAKSKK